MTPRQHYKYISAADSGETSSQTDPGIDEQNIIYSVKDKLVVNLLPETFTGKVCIVSGY